MFFLSLLVFPVYVAAETDEGIDDVYKVQWEADVNITIYIPEDYNTTSTLNALYEHASQNINVNHRGLSLFALETKLDVINAYYMSNDIPARIHEARSRPGMLAIDTLIKLASNTDSNETVDVLPDERYEAESTQDPLAQMGSSNKYYENSTDYSTSSSVTYNMTNFLRDSYPYMYISNFQQYGPGYASVVVYYANSTGHTASTSSVAINETDLILAQDWWVKIPDHPANFPYVERIVISNAKWTNFKIINYAANFTDSREIGDYISFTDTGLVGLSGLGSITSSVSNAIKKIPSPKKVASTAASAVGFKDVKDSVLSAVSKKTGVPVDQIADHVVNGINEAVKVPQALSNTVYNEMKKDWDQGAKTAIQMKNAANRKLKALTVSVGIKARDLKSAALRGADLTGSVVSGIAASGGKSLIGKISSAGSQLYNGVVDSTGKLLHKSAGMFSFLSGDFWNKAKSALRWIIIAVISVLGLIALIKFLNMLR